MSSENIDQELLSIANKMLREIEQIIPDDPLHCFGLLTEMTRIYDYLCIGKITSKNAELSVQEIDIIKNGWNIAASYLLKPLNTNRFPIAPSTKEGASAAISILYKFGTTVLLRRVSDMVKTGMMSAEKDADSFIFRKKDLMEYQHTDNFEFSSWIELEDKVKTNKDKHYKGWDIVDRENMQEMFVRIGNFFSLDNTDFSKYLLSDSDLDAAMLPLLRPWDKWHGVMMAYDATPETDYHFLAKAAELMGMWRNDAGLHPEANIDGVKASDLCFVIMFITGIYLKHVHFAGLAAKKYPEISIPQSITLWDSPNELINSIADFSRLDLKTVSKVFDLITLKASDVAVLKEHTSKFMPLLIGSGNGLVLRPISSLVQNPLVSIFTILEYRNPNIRHEIIARREEWLRSHLNAFFLGTRYQQIHTNIKLRKGNSVITDIDAAIHDNLTGELGLFQIKWQDFFYNDVKKLRSRASNLTKELDEWAEKATQWIEEYGVTELYKILGITLTRPINESSVFLFGLSRNVARVQGYGYKVKFENLAVANWPQFMRTRMEVGPAERVIKTIFDTLKSQENDKVNSKPLPFKISLLNKTFHFEDLWSAFED